MHHIILPIDSYAVIDDIAREIHKVMDLETSAHKTITQHKGYLVVMDKLAELVFNRLSDDLLSICKQLSFEPVTFTDPNFNPQCDFSAVSNTDNETLAVLIFTKYWSQGVASLGLSPVDACYDYFWYRNFDNNDTFKQQVLALFMPLVDASEKTISVTYTMFFKNENTVDVPKHIVEQGRDAIVKYFSELAEKGTINLTHSEFSHDTVRLADQTEIKE